MKHALMIPALTICGLLLLSCNNEGSISEDSGLPAKLELTIQGSTTTQTPSAMPLRAHGTLPTGTGLIGESEGTVNRITVGVFKTNGTTDVIYETTTLSGTNSLTLNATEGEREIIVVANAPEAHFLGVSTKADFLAKTISLDVTMPGGLGLTGQLSTNLPMTGQATTTSGGSTTTITLSQDQTTPAFVSLTRLVARVSISRVSCEFSPEGLYPNAVFTPTDIFLYQAKGTTDCATGTTAPITTNLMQGEASTSGNSDYRIYLGDTVTDFTNGSSFTHPYYYYAFANSDAGFPTKLIIKGTFDVNGDGTITPASGDGTVYYPIVINKNQAGTTWNAGYTGYTTTGSIDRNKTYALTATIKGKGVGSATEDINPANVSLTVSVEAWAMDIVQNVTFD